MWTFGPSSFLELRTGALNQYPRRLSSGLSLLGEIHEADFEYMATGRSTIMYKLLVAI